MQNRHFIASPEANAQDIISISFTQNEIHIIVKSSRIHVYFLTHVSI